ncbi:DNA replication protein DciA [Microlunatus aurantiacus]|uniref:DNA replication protein DciA n=1 Tax=Microlunatus aurantiacus TaxID=446786 RepID=A0ABP7DDV3_9ACTN
MSEPPVGEPPVGEPAAGDPPQGEPSGTAEVAPVSRHDPTGLDLARSIADSVGAGPRRRTKRRTQRPTRVDPVRSGARPDERDPKTLGTALENLVDSKGWSTDLSIRALLARWPALVGPTNAAHSWPESYAETVLTVRTESTVWATSLRTMAPQLVAKLNEALGDGTVTRVAVLGPQGPSWKKGRLSVRDGRGPRDTYG